MYIINSGGWYVGNSAIIEWLSELSEVDYIHGDLNVFRLQDGIMDMISEDDIDIKYKMISKNKKACLRGVFYALKNKTSSLITKGPSSLGKLEYYFRFRYYYFYYKALNDYESSLKSGCLNENKFWITWLKKLTGLFSISKDVSCKYTVLQNPFFYDETYDGHKDIWPKLFEPYKLIFVHRDPYDQLSDVIASGALYDSSWKRFHGKTGQLDPLERFCEISKRLFKGRIRLLSTHSDSEAIVVSFEEFIINHDKVSEELLEFLNLPMRISYWDTSRSKRNIGKGRSDPRVLELVKDREYMLEELILLRRELVNMQENKQYNG